MESLLLPLVVIIILVAAMAVMKSASSSGGDDEETWPFYPKKALSAPEQVLYHRLRQALPDHLVLAQVQLSRLLGVKKGHNYQSWLNRINRMSADFVVCLKDSSVVAVIELDDASHQRTDRKEADAKKARALASAGVRLVRWETKTIPDVATIRAEFMTADVNAEAGEAATV